MTRKAAGGSGKAGAQMKKPRSASELTKAREATGQAQAMAAVPTASAWVSANAGTGKTHVLVNRVLRLLLAGTLPQHILCLTFTKAAAAEMSNRVLQRLGAWALVDRKGLEKDLSSLLGRAPSDEERGRARTLFAAALETPGGLKVQTIHAFCERLLHRFPLEAGVPPGFAVLDDETRRAMLSDSISRVLDWAASDRNSATGSALLRLAALTNDESFADLIESVLGERAFLRGIATSDSDDGVSEFEQRLRSALGLAASDSEAAVLAAQAGLLRDDEIVSAIPLLLDGKKTDADLAEKLRNALKASPEIRIAAFEDAFLTATGSPRADRYITKAIRDTHDGLATRLDAARDRMHDLRQKQMGLEIAGASAALVRLAIEVRQGYEDEKAQRATLDYDDLIERTGLLIASPGRAEWVLYKLDNGLDHILVDEAQDTSPQQWTVITALAEEFFSGIGAGDALRTVFAVGDEKQSIYSFQGAVPKMFAQMGARFGAAAEAADRTWHRIPLNMSFRTVAPVLDAVDIVFSAPDRRQALTSAADEIAHLAHRSGQAGLVEIWDAEPYREPDRGTPWNPLGDGQTDDPRVRLTQRIAATIRHWLDNGERLPSTGEKIRAGDILVLLRKRMPFAPLVISALKAADIPVAGADRIQVTQQIAVEDLVTLGDFLLLPEDDLALATILKSPLFGLDDDDLFRIAHERKGVLWTALLRLAEEDARYTPIADTLKRWRAEADYFPPFEFYSRLLDSGGRRQRMLERLGPEAADAMNEFLNLAIRYDELEPPSLQGFLNWLRQGGPEIKRDMEQGRDEVRVMTVHGAKGLEAPIVFLPDTCSDPRKADRAKLVVLNGDSLHASDRHEADRLLAWPPKDTSSHPAVAAGKNQAGADILAEHDRLLYVAMTRARDRLYIGGYDTSQARPAVCWYETIRSALEPYCTGTEDAEGRQLLRLDADQTVEPVPSRRNETAGSGPAPLPEWAQRSAPTEDVKSIPIAPSRIAPLEEDAEIPTAREDQRVAPPIALVGENRFLRGLIVHALLQHLPDLPADRWSYVATSFVEQRGAQLPARMRKQIVTETLRILAAPEFSALFQPGSIAEAPIAGRIPAPDGKGAPLVINGQIDRLAVTDDAVLIIDYKTNRPPPVTVDAVSPAYLLQLVAYRLVLRELYPDKAVRAALLWTYDTALMPIPDAVLDAMEPRLWERGHGLEAA